jgi:hypothetical protein
MVGGLVVGGSVGVLIGVLVGRARAEVKAIYRGMPGRTDRARRGRAGRSLVARLLRRR